MAQDFDERVSNTIDQLLKAIREEKLRSTVAIILGSVMQDAYNRGLEEGKRRNAN